MGKFSHSFLTKSWQFDQEGKCQKVPLCDQTPNVKGKIWISDEVNRQIVVWYHVDDEKPSWNLYQLPELKSSSYISHGYMSRHMHAHVRGKLNF